MEGFTVNKSIWSRGQEYQSITGAVPKWLLGCTRMASPPSDAMGSARACSNHVSVVLFAFLSLKGLSLLALYSAASQCLSLHSAYIDQVSPSSLFCPPWHAQHSSSSRCTSSLPPWTPLTSSQYWQGTGTVAAMDDGGVC